MGGFGPLCSGASLASLADQTAAPWWLEAGSEKESCISGRETSGFLYETLVLVQYRAGAVGGAVPLTGDGADPLAEERRSDVLY